MKLNESFVYKWIQTDTNEYYIGVHRGSVDDGYVGSGKKFLNKYRKYKTKFIREILEIFSSYEDALDFEKQLVTTDLLKDPLCLNLKPGGSGGGAPWSTDHKLKMKKLMIQKWQDPSYKERVSKSAAAVWSDEYKTMRRSNKTLGYSNVDYNQRAAKRKTNGDYGKHRIGYEFSEDSKKTLSIKAKQRIKVECPHCLKIGPVPQMSRWHFDNCKEKIRCS